MIDTHCHVTFPQYENDREDVLSRASAAGVKRIVNPGTDLEQSRAAVELALLTSEVSSSTSEVEVPEVYAAVGVHPQDVGEFSKEGFQEIETLARHPRVVAVGEVGFEQSARSPTSADASAGRPALDVQAQWLKKFVELAREVGKPIIFHVRDAHREFREFLETDSRFRGNDKVRSDDIRGVVHCFSGTLEDAQFYMSRGLFLGITGIVTFPNAGALREVVREIPLEHLLLETDAPFLAPQSHRGQRNEPAYVGEVAREIARLKGTTVEVVEEATDRNARRLFSFS